MYSAGCCVTHYHNLRGGMSKIAFAREIWEFLRVRKKWWLLPVVVFLVMLGALIILAESSAVAPFLYTLF